MFEFKETRKKTESRIIVGLDIGTSKIGVVIGEVGAGGLMILGVGVSPSEGLRQGVVINLDLAVESISRAVREAQLTAGLEVRDVIVGIAGDHIRSVNSRGVVRVSGSDKEITQQDVDRVLDAAKAINLPIEREVLHVLPQEFIVDNQGGIRNPVGIAGTRLEAEVHIVTGAVTSAQNIVRSVEKSGLKVAGLVLEPLASSYSVLDHNEKDLGVALVDLGAGTTDLALFHNGSIRHTAVIPLGGQNVSNDIALGLRTPLQQAEEIKKKYGYCHKNLVSSSEVLEVTGLGGHPPREVSHALLCSIIQPRMEEIFSLAAKELKRSEYGDLMGAGIVLTGGGAVLKGSETLAEEIFGHPARVGIPTGFSGLVDSATNPMFATGVGLVLCGDDEELMGKRIFRNAGPGPFNKVLQWMKHFVDDFL